MPILLLIGGLLLHITWLQVLLAIVGLYAVWWVASTWASFIALPHVVRNGSLDLHVGTRAAMRIPLQDVDRVSREQRGWSDAIGPSFSGHTVALPVGGQTSICIRLRQPAVLRRSRGRLVETTEIHVQVDDPEALWAALDRAIGAFGARS